MTPILGIMASSISGSKAITSSFESIATATAAGGEMSLSLTSIPSTYKHLQVRIIARDTAPIVGQGSGIFYVNGDTGVSYTNHKLIGYNFTTTPTTQGGDTTTSGNMNFWCPPAANTAAAYGVAIIDIIDYANTSKYKTMRGVTGWSNNSTASPVSGIVLASTLWITTNAITSMNIVPYASGFSAGSSIALYGIRG